MKKVFLLIFLNFNLFAQNSNESTENNKSELKNGIGFRLGLNQSVALISISNSAPFSTCYKSGFHAGIVASKRINKFFSVQPELLYTQGGFVQVEDLKTIVAEVDCRIDRLQMPLFAKFDFGNNG